MRRFRNCFRGWPGLYLTGTCLLLAVVIGTGRPEAAGQDPPSKLSTVLADLAGAIGQEQGALASPTAVRVTPLVVDMLPTSVRDAMHGRRLRMNDRNEVQVYVLMPSVTDAYLQQLTAIGVTVEIADAARRRVQARIPVARLQAVAALPFVTFVRLPTYAVRHSGLVQTEGDAILHADALRSQLSLDGTGIKVGVISDGLKGVFATGCTTCGGVAGGPIATGDLLASSGTRNAQGVLVASTGGIAGRSFQANGDLEGRPPASPPCGFAGAGGEGTALLEIVHDLAPGAQLSFANADTDLAFNQAVNFLALNNDIVLDDFGFYGEAYDGTSPVSSNTANALNDPANRIRAYVTSVGNAADEHYIGSYVDSGVDGKSTSGIVNSGDLHLFQSSSDTTDVLGLGPQPYNLIALPTGGEVVIFLTWDDPFGASRNNYDLYLVQQSNGVVVAKSTDAQTGSQDPVEVIDYTNTGASGYFRILVQNVRNQASQAQLNLYSFEPECAAGGPRLLAPNHHERHNFNTATRSVSAQSDAGGSPVSVISVAAACSASAAAASATSGGSAPDESCLDRNNNTIEFFSSRGPTLDGRTKPDVTAIDGVSITGAGSFPVPFFGTSAASPHVGGIAALLLQAAPCLAIGGAGALDPAVARGMLRNLILDNATTLGETVPDNTFGMGRVDAGASAQKTLAVFKGSAALTVSGNTPLGASLSPAQLGFTDPNQCSLSRMSWTGGCGTSPGSTLTCPFGPSKVSVAASNNGFAFSPAADIQITVTNFGIGALPATATVAAGQSVVYQVAVTAQGGPFMSGITLGCTNLPVGGACSFSPPTVTPGAGTAQSTLTISTTTRAAGSLLARNDRPRAWSMGAAAVRRASWPALPWIGCALLVCCAASRWRQVSGLGSVMMFATFVVVMTACGSGGGTSGTSPNTPAPAVAMSPASLSFAGQIAGTKSVPQSVTLTNTGSASLAISGITAGGDFAQSNTCGSSLGAGAGCAINVTFTPTAAGQRTGTLSVADNAANSPHTVGLSGTGLAGGTPAGSYPVGITGTSGTLVQSGFVTIVVQ